MAVYQSAQNLLRLINNVMDLSRLEANHLNLTLDSLPLNPILEDVLAFNFGSTKPESIRLVGNLPPNLPPILGQRDRVQQMILGFIRFACKTQTTQVTLTATLDDEFVTMQVHAGPELLTAQVLTEMFELRVTIDSAGHSKLSRGGIELPLIRGLAQAHQGEAWAESSLEHGTSLYLKLRRG
jgi:signal transduction histidine kinase